MTDIIIIGGGVAGLTAAVYACRAGKTAMVLEKAGFGGQITYSHKIENFPSAVSISGTELADKMMDQAISQGAQMELEEALEIKKNDDGTGNLIRHKIKNGETLGSIAIKYRVKVNQIMKWNNMRNTNIRAGKYLKIYK